VCVYICICMFVYIMLGDNDGGGCSDTSAGATAELPASPHADFAQGLHLLARARRRVCACVCVKRDLL
jgi:hypothetical protein